MRSQLSRVALLLISLLVLGLGTPPARAQESTPPIIAVQGGQLYALTPEGAITQLTQADVPSPSALPQSQRDLFVSPDGAHVIYRRTPAFFAQAMADNLTGNLGQLPADLYLLDLTTGQEVLIAGHEADTAYNQSGRLYYRAEFARGYAPEGGAFAYLEEQGYPGTSGFASRLVVYDRAADETRILAESTHDSLGTPLTWSADGIWLGTTLYDPLTGDVLKQTYLNGNTLIDAHVWLDGRLYAAVSGLGITEPEDMTYLFDLDSGAYSLVPGYISSVSAGAFDSSLVLLDNSNDTRPRRVVNQDGETVYTPPTAAPFAVSFGLEPGGERFAFSLINTATVIGDAAGDPRQLDFVTWGLAWGALDFTVFDPEGRDMTPQPSADFDTPEACGTLPPAGLIPGELGQVMSGAPNRLRSAPSTDAEQINMIPSGAVFDVVEGQQAVCSDGIRWAQVTYGGITGWTAEGADGVPFVIRVP